MSEVTYRWVDGPDATDQDWDRIDRILEARGWASLNRPTTRILIAEDDKGELAGLIVLQLFPHAEPLWVRPSMRGSGIAETLADKMMDFLREIKVRGFIVMADNPLAAKLCEEHGMVKVESPVYIAK